MLSGNADVDRKIARYVFPNLWGVQMMRRLNAVMIIFRVAYPGFVKICRDVVCYGGRDDMSAFEAQMVEDKIRMHDAENILAEVATKSSFWQKYATAFATAEIGQEIVVTDKVKGKVRHKLYLYARTFGLCYVCIKPTQYEETVIRSGNSWKNRFEEYKMEKAGLVTWATIVRNGWQELPEVAESEKADALKYNQPFEPRWVPVDEDARGNILFEFNSRRYRLGRVKTRYESIKFIKCCN